MSSPGSGTEPLLALDEAERAAFCRRVFESLSDLVEGEAPDDFCRRVEEVLGECRPYLAMRGTFEATLELAHELGRDEPAVDEAGFRRCVEVARRRLGEPDP